MAKFDDLPDDALVRVCDIVRMRNSPGIVPYGKTTLLAKLKAGEFPASIQFEEDGPHQWPVKVIRQYLADLKASVMHEAA